MTGVGNCGVEEQIRRASDCLHRELKLPLCDTRVCLSRDPSGLSARCLVHKTWLETVSSSGKVFSPSMGLTPSERSALVDQGVAVEPPLQWVYATVIPKDSTVLPGCVGPVPNHGVVDDSKRSVLAYIDQVADLERRRVWQQFDRFQIDSHNYSGTQPVLGAFLRDFVLHMYGVQLMKLQPCDPPSIPVVSETSGRVIPSLCHPNVLPLFAALEGENAFFLLQPYVAHSLSDVVLFTPSVLAKSSVKQQFLLYQILQGLTEVHSHGVPQNRLDLSNVLVDEKLWIRLPCPNIFIPNQSEKSDKKCMDPSALHVTTGSTDSQLESSARNDLLKFTRQWLTGELSNFDYLMVLNHAAGRQVGNPDHHPVMPWIMDFSVSHGGWRDLTRSKYRLTKGDSQLDFMYQVTGMRSSNTVMEHGVLPPHHISDLLSDITYYIYLARRTPKHILCAHVRPLWVPNEYPKSIQRMQNWTPDECIPQFFSDPLVFTSIHPDLPDLELPSWADSPEDFIHQHRAALESSHVSESLHHWIDLAFGYKLSGNAALKAKNVILSLVDPHCTPKSTGIVQLFASPHPSRNALSKSLSRLLMAEKGLSCSYLFPVQSCKPICFGTDDLPVKIRKAEEQNKAGGSKPSSRRSSGGQLTEEANQEAQDEPEFLVEYPAPVVLDNQTSRTSPESGPAETGNTSSSKPVEESTTATATSAMTTTEPSDARSRLPTFWKQKSGSVPLNRPALINYGELPIDLREDYDPLSLLEEVTSLAKFGNSFLEKHKGLEKVLTGSSRISSCQYSLDNHIHADLLSVAILIIELLCPEKPGAAMRLASPATKLPLCRKLLQTWEILLPQFALGFVEHVFGAVLDEEGVYKPVSSDATMALSPPQLLVSEFNDQLLFPRYFVSLYEFLSFLVSNVEASEQGWTENPVDIAHHRLPQIFPILDAEGFDLLLPYLCPLFELPDTRFQATLKLFGQISKRFGPQKTTSLFLKPVLVTMEQPPNPAGHARLLYCLFIRQLIRGFGLQVFLERFISFLINALVKTHDRSAKDTADTMKARCQQPDPLVKHDITLSNGSANDVPTVPDELSTDGTASLTAADVQDQLLEVESFVHLEACDVDNVADDVINTDSNQLQQQDANVATCHDCGDYADAVTDMPELDETNPTSETISQAEAPEAWSSKGANSTGELLLGQLSDPLLQVGVVDVTKVAMATLEWLSLFLGPILTSAHLVLPLLKSLTAVQPVGDPVVLKKSPIMKMLMSMLDTYGKHYFLEQYLQFAAESVKACEQQRLTVKMEASLSATITLMRLCIRRMPVSTLLNQMEMMSQQIFQRVIAILSSPSHCFPSGSNTRRNVCHQLLDTMLVIANQLGREAAQPVLAVLLQQFFSSFDRVIPTASPDDLSSIKASLSNSVNMKHEQLGIREELVLDRIPGSNAREHVTDEILSQLQDVFTPELAEAAYVPFCQLIGQINMRRMLYNADLIEQVSYSHINQDRQRAGGSGQRVAQPGLISRGKHKMQATEKLNLAVVDATHNNPLQPGSSDDESEEELDLSQVHFGRSSWFIPLGSEASVNPDTALPPDGTSQPELPPVSLTGQLLDQFEAARVEFNQILGSGSHFSGGAGGSDASVTDSSNKATSKRHLEGNWLAHWKNQLGSHVRSPFGFDQLKLQTYTGHTGLIRSLCAVEGQRMFLSGSRDRTVRLWSLSSQGDGSAEIPCQLIYRRHQKTVLAVEFLERTGSVISCSGSIHIWDPDTAQCLRRLESTRSPVGALSCLPPPHSTAVIATTDGTLKFVDVRIGKFMHDWKIQPGGVPRSMCVDQDGRYIIVGLAFGILTLLDVRTGLCIKKWKPHEGDITKIRAMTDKFVVASNDGLMSMWHSSSGSLVSELKGHTEPVFDCQLYRDDVISVTSSKLGIHTIYDKESTFGSYRIKPDLVRSGLSALDLLPLSSELIIGTDSGHIYLCA